MPGFRSDDSLPRDVREAIFSAPPIKRLVRAAGNIRILLLGVPESGGKSRVTRPVATGSFSYPAFAAN